MSPQQYLESGYLGRDMKDKLEPKQAFSSNGRSNNAKHSELTPVDSSEFVKKTVIGRNAETKRVVELSIADIEDMTGIPREEMFGTDETGEKVAYIGAPWQALNVMDSKRMFVFDYEYGEIANFSRDYYDLEEQVASVFYGEYSPGLEDHAYQVEQDYDEIVSDEEKQWVKKAYQIAQEINDIVSDLRFVERNEDSKTKEKELLQLSERLNTMLQSRKKSDADIIEQRERDRLAEGNEHAPYHPVEGFHKYLTYLVEKVENGVQDIRDYEKVVVPRIKEFEDSLPADVKYYEREIKMRFEELSILSEIRLQKKTEESHVVVGIFPNLPLKAGSMDRIVCSYSISTHVIPEATEEDFLSWLSEIQRVLKPGGKAYIFPMQQGFPFGREYDEYALEEALDEFGLENGGQLEYEYYDNPNEDAWRQDTSLIITKKT